MGIIKSFKAFNENTSQTPSQPVNKSFVNELSKLCQSISNGGPDWHEFACNDAGDPYVKYQIPSLETPLPNGKTIPEIKTNADLKVAVGQCLARLDSYFENNQDNFYKKLKTNFLNFQKKIANLK